MEIISNPELKGLIETILGDKLVKKHHKIFEILDEERFWDFFLLSFLLYRIANHMKFLSGYLLFLHEQSSFRNMHLLKTNRGKTILVLDRDLRYVFPLPLFAEKIEMEKIKNELDKLMKELFLGDNDEISKPLILEFSIKEKSWGYLRELLGGFESSEDIKKWDRSFLCLLSIYLNAKLKKKYKIEDIKASPQISFSNGKNREADIILKKKGVFIDIEITTMYSSIEKYVNEKLHYLFYDCLRDNISKAHLLFVGFLFDDSKSINEEEETSYLLRYQKKHLAHLRFPFPSKKLNLSFSYVRIPSSLDDIKEDKNTLMKDFKKFIQSIVEDVEKIIKNQ